MKYLLIVILVILSAFFSGSEMAFASVSEKKLRLRYEENKTIFRKQAHYVGKNFDNGLITILIGNNLVNIFTSSIGTVIALELMGENGVWIASAVITVLLLTFGEIIPKIIASRKALEYTTFSGLILRVFMILTFPLVWLCDRIVMLISRLWEKRGADDDTITEDDLETIIDTVEDEGVVDEDTADLLQGALDFGDCKASEIMIPRVDMFAIDIDDSHEKHRYELMNTIFTRVPVYKNTVDNIIGIINMNTLLMHIVETDDFELEKAMSEPLFVPGTMKIDDVLDNMRHEKKHLAVVTDEYGGVDGIITMEDILEQIVGEIWDEQDTVDPEFIEISENTYKVDGDMRILDLFDELDVDSKDFDDDAATVGGFAVENLNDYAEVGDTFTYKNLVFRITDAEERRVLSIEVEVLPESEDDEEE